MFVIVRYGDEQQQIVNTNCKVAVFLEFIKAKIGCSATDTVDVSDERGHVKNLRGHPKDCARRYLKDRETLIVLKVHSQDDKSTDDKCISSRADPMTRQVVYTPLLLSLVSNKGFNDALNPHKDETSKHVLPSKPTRARSFTFDNDEFRRARSKSRSSWSSSGRKSTARKSRKI